MRGVLYITYVFVTNRVLVAAPCSKSGKLNWQAYWHEVRPFQGKYVQTSWLIHSQYNGHIAFERQH